MSRPPALVLLLIAAALPLAADEVRLTYTLGMDEVTVHPKGADSFDDEWDSNERWELGAYSNLGTIWGFGVGIQRADVAGDDWKLDYQSTYARIYSGMSPVQTESFTWEIVGYTGLLLGEADLDRSSPALEGGSDRDVGWEFGAQTSLTVSLTRMFFIGAGVTYGWSELTLDLGSSQDLDQQGLGYFGYAGMRF